ncbi:hypothetical protein E4U42_003505 [Claviceps africana]|uniref:AAA+ ATPase domain-containing protein n=1 Tax=Claviceps africana TaxID=83212 RepID=A0A8K0NLH7_9HYPO|nr:hypothetical protein E4U42_003505 [Claviceps africana]
MFRQKIIVSMDKNNDKSAIQSTFPQDSPKPSSKTKPDLSNRGSAGSSAPRKPSRRVGRRPRSQIRSRWSSGNHLTGSEDSSSSDSEVSSLSESDDSSSTESDGDAAFSSADQDRSHRKRRSRRSRKSRSVPLHQAHKSPRIVTTPPHGVLREIDGSSAIPSKEAGCCRKEQSSCRCTGVVSQQDMACGLAQLELRFSQLQHQLDSFIVYQAPQTRRLFVLPQQPILSTLPPVFSTSGIPYTTADLTPREYPSMVQTSHKDLEPSASTHPGNLAPTESSAQLDRPASDTGGGDSRDESPTGRKLESRRRAKNKVRLSYKRVDAIWDSQSYNFKLQPTAKPAPESKFDGYLFHVRRTFDADGRYRASFVDIKSKLLRQCLQDVIGSIRGVNLVEDTSTLDPNLLFLYLEDLRFYLRRMKQLEPADKHRRYRHRTQRRLNETRKELKVLVKYLDKDYAKVKRSLYPMLNNGIISFEYFWALWKPGTLVYSAMYGQGEDARVFSLDMASRHATVVHGNFYRLEGKYLDFDGNQFFLQNTAEDIPEFQGTRKISSLPCHPLAYRKDVVKVRQTLIKRGKNFVSLSEPSLKEYSGLAYVKRKKGTITKVHIPKSRIMVDTTIFRRMNPNYFGSSARPKDAVVLLDSDSSDGEEDVIESSPRGASDRKEEKKETVCGGALATKAPQEDLSAESKSSPDQSLPTTSSTAVPGVNGAESSSAGEKVVETPKEDSAADSCLRLTDDAYLLAPPVVLGFSFSEKLWLEFSVSRLEDVHWNDDAWSSLVLPLETKNLIKALVKSRKYNLSQTTDDVIKGKGKGLVSVLHGPPGTGKTLTAEGISELLQCPLYIASAGELGTTPKFLEEELQRILDICHSWGAILLLDEADVFLERRNMQDLQRNALVSIFLRQLEYFQGILFLTTNRVQTFDEAFQSRIHIALRYDELDIKAKKAIFKLFIDRVKAHGQLPVEPFTDEELTYLAKHGLNGREIKNMIGSAQDLALNKVEALSMRHIEQVLDIHVKFGRDLRGGTGYEDAMRSYC